MRKDRLNRIRPILACGIALLIAACAQLPEQEPFVAPVFPPPPEPPRYYWEHTLVSTAQIGQNDSTSRWRRMLTGEGRTGQAFSKPIDVTVCQGRVFVSDSVTRRVLAFDFPGDRWYVVGDDGPGILVKPLGIATDRQCTLYVADQSGGRIVVYDAGGNFLDAFGGEGVFTRLTNVAVNPEGTHIFGVDTGGVDSDNHRVRVFDATNGEHLYDIGSRGNGEGQLNIPLDIDVGPDGRLYVVDSANFRVQVYEIDGTVVRSFGGLGRRLGTFARPKGIGLDPDGNVYVSDTSHGNFQIFDPEGKLLLFVGNRGQQFEPAKYMLPNGLDVDEDGRVYMVDQFFRKVDIFRPAALAPEDGYLGVWRVAEDE